VVEGKNGMSSESAPKPMSSTEKRDVEELSAPRARIIYEVVRKQGDEELDRPPGSLFWSGLAGGITIMMSVVAEGALHSKLPANMPLRQVISDLGYSLGFVMVILGRMQLFTEQTIVTVLPNMAEPTWKKLGMTVRLWAIVFAANMIGTCAAAAIIVFLHLTSHDLTAGMVEVSGALIQKAPMDVLLQAVPAGFLMASVAWIRAGVTESEFWVVFIITYAIALGGFAHVVAGSAEAFLMLFAGHVGPGQVASVILPALIGNIIGGTGLFALLAHAQVRQEI
jgi:formate/nitrite transporter FocA (FNT family)